MWQKFLAFLAAFFTPAEKVVAAPKEGLAVVATSIKLAFTGSPAWSRTVQLPATGKFVTECHYATPQDKWGTRIFPTTVTENISAHLERTVSYLKSIGLEASVDSVYPASRKWTREWTPAEGGLKGQGSVGNLKPTIEQECWQGNMMWAKGQKPAPGTKFLLTNPAKNLSVVIQMGFETGPRSQTFLGGVTPEVHWYLQASSDDHLILNKLADQSTPLGPVSGKPVEEPDRPDDPMPEDWEKGIEEPEVVVVKGVKYPAKGNYKTPSGKFSGLVVHYTVSGRKASSARGVVSYLASKGLGCMVMDEDGKIYIPEGFDLLKHWGYHAGVSKWKGRSSVSDIFAGMEICCWGRNSKEGPFRESKGEANIIAGKYQTFTDAQEKALTNFILWARSKNPEFKLENVVGHDELRAEAGKRGDKQDPGASLSMTMPEYRAHLVKAEKELKS